MHVSWGSIGVPAHDVEIPVGPDQWRFNQYLYWKRRSHAAPEEKGYWSLVLHQHLPFVRHPEYEVGLEEQWFFEAVVSVYTQLLHVLWNLERDKVDFRLTVSLTPPLLSMMQDPLLKLRAARHIDECIKLATQRAGQRAGQAVARRRRADPLPLLDGEARLGRLRRRPDARLPRLPERRKARGHHLPGDALDPPALQGLPGGDPRAGPDREAAVRAGLRPQPARHLARRERLDARARRVPRRPRGSNGSS